MRFDSSYGKEGIPVAYLDRTTPQQGHRFVDLTVNITLTLNSDAAFTQGDNSAVVPTDTMKNQAYVAASRSFIEPASAYPEVLRAALIEHPTVTSAKVDIVEHPWRRITIGDRPSPHAFTQSGVQYVYETEHRTDNEVDGQVGLRGLRLLKTTDSAFKGFAKCSYTTLPETNDRILATSVDADWTGEGDLDCHSEVESAIIRVFVEQFSRSVQETMYQMAEAVFEACKQISAISLKLPNLHYIPWDGSPFNIDHSNSVFIRSNTPNGIIKGNFFRK